MKCCKRLVLLDIYKLMAIGNNIRQGAKIVTLINEFQARKKIAL